MIKAIVIGAAGRMGQRLVCAVASSDEFKLVGATENAGHPAIGKDAGVNAGIEELGVKIQAELDPLLKHADVVIDFTAPEVSIKTAEAAARNGTAVVIGTTAIKGEPLKKIEQAAKKIPIMLAPNMSTGVNLLFHLVKKAAEVLGEEFDLEIVETHHRLKKDAPSGTAVRIAEILAHVRGLKLDQAARYHREGMIGERPKKEIGIQTLRAGDIVGEHTILMAGPGERLELTHRAHSRDTFAYGAIRAARWLVKQKQGIYSMQDFLGLD